VRIIDSEGLPFPSHHLCVRCSADLSGQAYGTKVSRQWGDRIVAEFRQQAEKERAAGLPVMQFMAELDTPHQIAKLQHSFITNITLPLWQRLSELFSGLEEPVANLQSNRLLQEAELVKYPAAASRSASPLSHESAVHSVDETNIDDECD
jgi:hypothetical protein